jgi:predicted DCC family thiol-disulfide oxidoreductase YuxK
LRRRKKQEERDVAYGHNIQVPDQKPVLLYDGRCGFCKIWIDYWKLLTGDRIEYATSQEAGDRYPQIPRQAFSEAVQFVRPDGTFSGGARAVFETLGKEKTYEGSRIVSGLSELAYRLIAGHRNFFYQVTRFTFGTHIEPARFAVTQGIFLRLLAIVYAIAFASLAVQITGLIGSRGILPISEFLRAANDTFGRTAFLKVPMIFFAWPSSDAMLRGLCWTGVALSVLAFAGYFRRTALALLFVLYLSFCSAGQDFLSFQWDSLLLEAGFLAIFLSRARIVVWLFRWLLFRLYFLSGCVKLLSHDPTWRDLTAMEYHYHTQPLPTVLAWFAEKLPAGFQHASTWMVLAIEIGAPFLIFAPRRLRHFGACWLIGLQVLILLTGNYAFFNLLTLAIGVFLFDDQTFGKKGPGARGQGPVNATPDGSQVRTGHWPLATGHFFRTGHFLRAAFTALILILSLTRMMGTFIGEPPAPLRIIEGFAAPFQIVSSYGLFAVMTTTREEIIVEGSNDGETWLPYEFRYKPGDVRRAPRWVAPHQPRLDWQMWFAALGNYRANPWFVGFTLRLLEGSPEVLSLLEKNPFPGQPPRYVRATAYEYTFTDAGARHRTGAWWNKHEPGRTYLPAIGLRH